MKSKQYKDNIEALAKMNNPPVSQCIALLRQIYNSLDETLKLNKDLLEACKRALVLHYPDESLQLSPLDHLCKVKLLAAIQKAENVD